MEYLLVMSLSGSTMTVICLLLRRLLKDRVSARLYFLLARAAILYFLVPLPFLKKWYGEAIRTVAPETEMRIAQIPLTWTNYAVHADGKMYVNTYAGIQMTTVFVWLSVAGALMARQLLEYVRTVRRISGYTNRKMTERQKAYIAGLKKQFGVRRHISLYQGTAEESAVTFGVFRPVIICGREIGSREAEFIVRHEMVHIRRLDALWKILLQFVTFLHWWNPVMWMLYCVFDRVCELSCDETVMQGKSEKEIKEYLRLLIEEAQRERETGNTPVRWKAGFRDNKRKIRERMDNLMRKKRWNRFAAGALVVALTVANSMTVFAYRDTFHEYMPEEMSQEEIENKLNVDETQFAPDGIGEEEMLEFDLMEVAKVCYDTQFTDEEGNIYPVGGEEFAVPYRGCNHNYVSGTLTDHTKNSDGSCTVVQYRAQRCSKCGTVVQGDYIGSSHYAVCPH